MAITNMTNKKLLCALTKDSLSPTPIRPSRACDPAA